MDPVTFSALFSLVMLALGTWCIIEGVDIIYRKHKSSIVEGFLLSLVSASPGVFILVTALNRNRPVFGFGVLTGSIALTTSLGLGLVIFLAATAARTGSLGLEKNLRAQGKILAMTVPLLLCVAVDGFCLSFGVIGLCEYAIFVWYNLSSSSQVGAKPKDEPLDADDHKGDEPRGKGFLFVFVGLLILWLYSDDFVECVIEVGQINHLDVSLLGFFLGPLAIQLPDLITCARLALLGKRDSATFSIAYLLGAAVTQTSLLIGLLCIFGYHRQVVWSKVYGPNLMVMAWTSLAAALVIWLPASVSRSYGAGLILFFFLIAVSQLYLESPTLPILASDSVRHISAGGVAQQYAQVRDIISEISLTPFV